MIDASTIQCYGDNVRGLFPSYRGYGDIVRGLFPSYRGYVQQRRLVVWTTRRAVFDAII